VSLYHLPPDELAPVLDRLHHRSDAAQALGRNRGVWERELAALEQHLQHAAPVTSGVTVRTGRSAPSDGPADAVVHLDPDQLIRRLELRASWPLAEPTDLVGQNPVELLHFLSAHMGVVTSTHLEYVGGVELRTMTFDDGGVLTAALHSDDRGDHRWELTVQRPGAGAPA
jgi:hypothetical protein